MRNDFKHPQVVFQSLSNRATTVDRGLLEIMSLMRMLGVRTQYSCQGDEDGHSAYILADTRSFRPVIKQILDELRYQRLSPEVTDFVEDFVRHVDIEIELIERTSIYLPDAPKQYFSYERKFTRLGDRTTVRWPVACTWLVEQLLVELLYLRSN